MLVRSWDYRQRRLARGVWFRLRRVLADASAAFVISPEDALQLIAEGYGAEPVGYELEPPRVIVFAPGDRVAHIPSARVVAVRLSGELLDAKSLALTRFDPNP